MRVCSLGGGESGIISNRCVFLADSRGCEWVSFEVAVRCIIAICELGGFCYKGYRERDKRYGCSKEESQW